MKCVPSMTVTASATSAEECGGLAAAPNYTDVDVFALHIFIRYHVHRHEDRSSVIITLHTL